MAKRTCNRHWDCDEADKKAKERYEENLKKPWGERERIYSPFIDHCHDDCCEDCFGS